MKITLVKHNLSIQFTVKIETIKNFIKLFYNIDEKLKKQKDIEDKIRCRNYVS